MRYEKIDPGLLLIWRDYTAGRDLSRHVVRWGLHLEGDNAPIALVSLHTADKTIEGLDPRVRINSGTEYRRTAYVPLACVEALTDHPSVDRLVLSRRLRFL